MDLCSLFITLLILTLMLIAILAVSYFGRRPYFFLSYITQKKGGPPVYQVAVWKGQDPLYWQIDMNNRNKEVRYRLLNFKRIPKKHYERYTTLSNKN